jgi:hypothetical protein
MPGSPRSANEVEVNWAALGFILLVALGVRLLLMSDALNYDEAQHFLVAKSPLLDDFVREFSIRGHPPLAYLIMKPFVALGSSVYWVRLAALLCGLLSIALAYLSLLRLLRAPTPALVGALLVALMPLAVQHSIEARHYSLCLMLVWACLWMWQRMRASGFERYSHHVLLALLQLLTIFAEYSAVFAVTALSLVVYAPLMLREARRRGWWQISRWALLQFAVAGAAGGAFLWQYRGTVPSFEYTRAALYVARDASSAAPSMLDIPGVLGFLWRQLGFFQHAILPPPFGLAVLAALGLAFAPWLRNDPRAGACRSIAIYALLSLALLMVASLLGFFPFGGLPRHSAALLPGILQ